MRGIRAVFVLIAVTMVGGLVYRSVTAGPYTATAPLKGVTEYRAEIATSLNQAAKKARVSIDTSKMAITTREKDLLAIAPVSKPGDAFLFAQVSLSNAACARLLPSGYYTVKAVTNPKTKKHRALFVNAQGKTVASFPMTREQRKARPEERDKSEVGIQLRHTGGAVARTIVGLCKCQYIFPFSWRRLHSVIV